ncbi:uncharacterized protein BCR38DRAFT_479463 [Pseudomassariella vexata]|uniref:Uncharacterized protein n=1 Tax=Pseudomassariella vexata TaxID=1141098 RepID=A0A1Y2EH85_9PEZI|nr:uncharacterized protein BCR38DRAFT_479463 [Pseudomassariella vexata]ORY70930.1 hypothetical protein BCR38DRAFT_479463 [Pseudomassariella vexata]
MAPQTMYNRPYPQWTALAVIIPFTALLIAVAATQGVKSPATWIVLFVEVLIMAVFIIIDPGITIASRREHLPDGSVVTIRRPIVGFKKYERRVGVLGGYDVRDDGSRYEEAYIRL